MLYAAAPHLVHADAALDVDDGAVEGAAHVLEVREDERLVHIKAAGNDVLAILQRRAHKEQTMSVAVV
jgi:hypothetical protein